MPGAELTAAGTDAGPRSRLLPGARARETGETVRTAPQTVEHGTTWSWLVLGGTVAAGVVGVLLIALAARLAAGGTRSGVVDTLTWVGLAVAVLPAVAVACTRDGTAAARWTALATVAVATVVPVGLRSGAGPVTPDDLLRYAQLSSLRSGAPLFVDRLPAVVADQPGLAGLATTLWRVSGLTVWDSALVVVVVVHVVAVVGVRTLVRAFGFGERVAVAAAVVWALGPGVLVATAEVDGGGLGLALSLWSLAAVVQAATSAQRARRIAWSATAVTLAAATAVSDLVAAWSLVGLTLLVAVATIGVSAPPVAGAVVRRAWWPAAAGVVAVTALWSLTPAGRRVLGDLDGVAAAGHRSWTTGTWDIVFGGVALLLALALAVLGGYRQRGRFGETGIRFAVGVAVLLPLSLIGLVAGATTTLAALVLPVLAAAIAPFVASGLLSLWDLGARRTRSAAPARSVSAAVRQVQRDTRVQRGQPARTAPRPTTAAPVVPPPRPDPRAAGRPDRDRRVPAPLAAAIALVAATLLLLGSAAATTPTASDRIGPPLATAAVPTAEVLAVTDRLTALAGPGFRFVAADPRLADVLVAVAGGVDVTAVDPAAVFETAPTASTAAVLRDAGVGWLVDLSGADSDAADTLGRQAWLTRVLATADLAVYRVRPAAPGVDPDVIGSDVVPAGGS